MADDGSSFSGSGLALCLMGRPFKTLDAGLASPWARVAKPEAYKCTGTTSETAVDNFVVSLDTALPW